MHQSKLEGHRRSCVGLKQFWNQFCWTHTIFLWGYDLRGIHFTEHESAEPETPQGHLRLEGYLNDNKLQGKTKNCDWFRHTRREAVWLEDARQQHKGLLPTVHVTCYPANKMKFNPTEGGDLFQARRTAGGKRSLWEVLGLGKMSWDGGEGRRLGLPHWVAPALGSGGAASQKRSWSTLPAHPSLSAAVFLRALGFLRPNAVLRIAPHQMRQLYFSVSNSIIAASWKAATLVNYGA